MASTAASNNGSVPPTQPLQFSFTGSKTASLADANEPNNSSSQQQAKVGTFPQQTSGGAPTVCFNSYCNEILLF